MKRIIGALLLMFVTVGCSSKPLSSYDDPPSKTAVESAYLSVLTDHAVYYSSDDAAVKMGHQVCESFDAGASFLSIIDILDKDYSAYEAGVIVGTAVGSFCPEHAGDTPK